MTTQLFRGRTEDEARQVALEAVGDHGVVLTARRVPRRGFSGMLGLTEFEVAAVPSRGAPFARSAYVQALPKKKQADEVGRLRAELRTELRTLKSQVSRPAPAADVAAELAAVRRALDELTAASSPQPKKRDRAASLIAATSIEGPAATRLARTMRLPPGEAAPATDEAWSERLRDALSDLVKAAPYPVAKKRRACVSVVGPSGVGKTTTLAKLAARAVAELEASVELVTCDAFRVGAVDQLARYAELLGARFTAVSDGRELASALERSRADFVFVDTPGQLEDISEDTRAALTRTLEGRERDVLLCLPASTRSIDAEEIARAFAPLAPTALAVTKLDETTRPAGIVHGTTAARLPVSALCFGPRVPEDIGPATAGAMLDRLVPQRRPR
jgi:flagellar biosynthesis protein FlhF